MLVNDYVRARIRELRIAQQLRVEDVARRGGIPQGSYSCLETGRYRINLDTLYKILFALGAGIAEVWPKMAGQGIETMDEASLKRAVRESERQARAALAGPDDLLQAVSRSSGVSLKAMLSKARGRELSEARALAVVLSEDFNHITKISLAKRLGRDNSGLVHLAKRFKGNVSATKLRRMLAGARRELKQILKERGGR